MLSVYDDQPSRSSSNDCIMECQKSVGGTTVRMNGLSQENSALNSDPGSLKLKENGLVNHLSKTVTSGHKHRDGHHHPSSSRSSISDKEKQHNSSKYKEGSLSGSSKHSISRLSSKHKESSSSSTHKDNNTSSSSSYHREGSSSAKFKEGDTSSSPSSHKEDRSSSAGSEPIYSPSSLPEKINRSKHKEESKYKDSHSISSSSSRTNEGSSSKSKSNSLSLEKHKNRNSISLSLDKHKNMNESCHYGKDEDNFKSLSSKQCEAERHATSSNGDKHKSHFISEEDKISQEKSTTFSHSKGILEQIKKEADVGDTVTGAKPMEIADLMNCHVSVKREIISSPVKLERQSPASKPEPESEEDDKPLSVRQKESKPSLKRFKKDSDSEDDDQECNFEDEDSDVPLSARVKAKRFKSEQSPKRLSSVVVTPKKKAPKKNKVVSVDTEDEPVRKKKKGEEEQIVWKWWEEKREDDGVKWYFLEHKGPIFAPVYESLPKDVRFYYDGKPMELSPEAEEVAVFYGRMLDHDYTTRDVFNNNFMKDWRQVMTAKEKTQITDIKKCNFHEILDYFKKKTEEKKAMSKEEKQKIKKENEELIKEYGFCTIDHHKEKIGNFKVEPPGLFRGRGDHPKQGMLKKRINPEDVIINCSKDSKIPVPPAGHKWKEVRHDNTVTWLACWTENIQGSTKYVMLNAASKLKGEKDWQKYETARKLHKCVDKIRAQYQEDWKSKEMRIRQRAVALYFIDKLALRAGNEKEEGETADTVGCCSLRVEHIKLHNEKDGKQHVVEFDFLGKDCIRYQNSVPVEKRVFKNLQLFMENKQSEDDLFDRLNTTILNKHLQELMEGLTAKVFRTFNASRTLSEQLELLTNPDDSPAAKILAYNRANRAVAILCNHQRAVPKTFEKSMENLTKKIDAKKAEIKKTKKDIKAIKADYKKEKSLKTKTLYEKKKKMLARLQDQLTKLEVQATDKDENKEIALGTSKLNYLDPRISVAWCKKYDIPLEKIYNKTQRDKFRWAIDMATKHFKF